MTLQAYISALAPEIVLVIGACITLMMGVAKSSSIRAMIAPCALAALVLSLASAAIVGIVTNAPPGLRVTQLSQYVRMIALGVGALVLLVNWHLPRDGERGEFFSMILFTLCGVCLTSVANDLVLLFFALELVSVPTYVLVALSRDDSRASEATVKYFFLGALSAALMAYGFSFLYGCAGSTTLIGPNGTGIVGYFLANQSVGSFAVLGLLISFVGLFFKIAAVPFHVYAPDVYEGAASPVTGLLGFLPKLAGFVAIIQIMDACNWHLPASISWMFWFVAAATMTVGNVLALLQTNVKRILAYSSISHTGYMMIGLLVGPGAGGGPMRDGVAAMLFYIGVYGLMNLGIFAVISTLAVKDEPLEELADLSGLSRRHPGAAAALAICAFSLMGFPPTAGFLGKVYIFSSAFSLPASHEFAQPLVVLAVIGVLNSAIGAVYYLRIASACYVGDDAPSTERIGGSPLRVAAIVCSAAMLILFIWPAGLVHRAGRATAEMMMHQQQTRSVELVRHEDVGLKAESRQIKTPAAE